MTAPIVDSIAGRIKRYGRDGGDAKTHARYEAERIREQASAYANWARRHKLESIAVYPAGIVACSSGAARIAVLAIERCHFFSHTVWEPTVTHEELTP